MVTSEQKLDFENELTNKRISLEEKLEEQNDKQDIGVIRICFKCSLLYSELINRVLDKKTDIDDDININDINKDELLNKKKDINLLDPLFNNNSDNNICKENTLQELKNILLNHSNFSKKIDNETMNNFIIKELLEDNNFIFKDFINKDILKCPENNGFLNNKSNIDASNDNYKVNEINLCNEKINPQNNNNNNFLNNEFLNHNNNTQNFFGDFGILKNYTNYMNSLNNNIPFDLNLNSSLNNSKTFYNQNIQQNLGNNIFHERFNFNKMNDSIFEDLNKNFIDKNFNAKLNIEKDNLNIIGKANENHNDNPNNIYHFIYQMRNALNQITEYLTIFENNNNDYNNSILDDIESLTVIFSRIISKMKFEYKDDKTNKENIGNNIDEDNNCNDHTNLHKNNEVICLNQSKDNNIDNNSQKDNKNSNNTMIDKIIEEDKENNADKYNDNIACKDNIDNCAFNIKINIEKEKENEGYSNKDINKNEINEEKKDKEINKDIKREEENNEEAESLDTYLDFILTINDSFKNKLKSMKIYNDLKNLFFKVLFENIEKLLLRIYEIANEGQAKSKVNSFKMQRKSLSPDIYNNGYNGFSFDNSSNNIFSLSNLSNHPLLPLLNMSNYNHMFPNNEINMGNKFNGNKNNLFGMNNKSDVEKEAENEKFGLNANI